jgi:hypothetical protein
MEVIFSKELTTALEKPGAKNFKRKILGIFGKETIKSLDELAIILYKIKATNSIKEGMELIKDLDEKYFVYSGVVGSIEKCLKFNRMNHNGIDSYKITRRGLLYPECPDDV